MTGLAEGSNGTLSLSPSLSLSLFRSGEDVLSTVIHCPMDGSEINSVPSFSSFCLNGDLIIPLSVETKACPGDH